MLSSEERAASLARLVGQLLPPFVAAVLCRRVALALASPLIRCLARRTPRLRGVLCAATARLRILCWATSAAICSYHFAVHEPGCAVETRTLGLVCGSGVALLVCSAYLLPNIAVACVFTTVLDRSSLAPLALVLAVSLRCRSGYTIHAAAAIAAASVYHFTQCHLPSSAAVAALSCACAATMCASRLLLAAIASTRKARKRT